MTPREYYRESEAVKRRWRDESDRDVVLAWRAAAYFGQAMVGKLPDLQTALSQSHGEPERQTVAEQIAHLKTLSRTVGGRLVPVSPETLAKLRRPMRES